ncbi:hypothetical protein DVH24_026364, partial [Malus domestica]
GTLWGWKGILQGRKILKAGLRWRVRDGRSVKVLSDLWLPILRTFKLLLTHPDRSQDLRKTKRKFELGIKLDMNKAYDWVEWDFLQATMVKMGFDEKWIDLVMKCVLRVDFAGLINGKPGKIFKPTRGLRQGDLITLLISHN